MSIDAVTLDPVDGSGVSQWADEALAVVSQAASLSELKEAKIAVLGDKSPLTLANRAIKDLPKEQRATAGQVLGGARKLLSKALAERSEVLEKEDEDRVLREEAVDVTLPGMRFPQGARHPLSSLIEEISDFFSSMGWEIGEGPEIEHEWFNFDSLNFDPDHPARQMQDTFYVDGSSLGPVASDSLTDSAALVKPGTPSNLVMRTHTSPVQSRAMLERGVPLYLACPGKVFRSDALDATHTPVFHQVEGLAVDRGITMADLKGVLDALAKYLFGKDVKTRLRPSFFPFTEPSAEMDFWFPQKKGGPGWIEWGGCGMVNPNVLIANGVDPDEYTAFAFGMGLERTLMLRHGISDMRDIVEGDVRFSEQFGLFGKGA